MNEKTSVDLSVPFAITAAAQDVKASGKTTNPMMGQLSAQYQGLPDDIKAQWNYANNQVQNAKDPNHNKVFGSTG